MWWVLSGGPLLSLHVAMTRYAPVGTDLFLGMIVKNFVSSTCKKKKIPNVMKFLGNFYT